MDCRSRISALFSSVMVQLLGCSETLFAKRHARPCPFITDSWCFAFKNAWLIQTNLSLCLFKLIFCCIRSQLWWLVDAAISFCLLLGCWYYLVKLLIQDHTILPGTCPWAVGCGLCNVFQPLLVVLRHGLLGIGWPMLICWDTVCLRS